MQTDKKQSTSALWNAINEKKIGECKMEFDTFGRCKLTLSDGTSFEGETSEQVAQKFLQGYA